MPYKKYKKNNKKRFRKKPFYKNKVKKRNQVVTYHIPKKMHMPFPPRVRTKFTTTSTGWWPSGSAVGFASVEGNIPYHSFNTLGYGDFTAGFAGLPNPAVANATLSALGLSSMIGLGVQPYQLYRCYASKITVRVNCLTSSDAVYIAACPVITACPNYTVNTFASFSSISQAPYSVVKEVNIGIKGIINSYMDTSTLFGKSRSAIQDLDIFTGSVGTVAGARWCWQIGYITSSDTNLTDALGIEVTITHYCELLATNFNNLPES